MGSVNKVKFFDEHKEHYLSENAALQSKLQSKVEALSIITKELDKCCSERDQFKLMAEQLLERNAVFKKQYNGPETNYVDGRIDYTQTPGRNVAQLLESTREMNKTLILEVESLKQKLAEAEGDIKVLRNQLHHQRYANHFCNESHVFPSHQREELVEQLEKANLKISQLRSDLQTMLDDKEEIIKERDAFKCKVHRLNHALSVSLKAENSPLLDGDALITENKYLHERLQQAETEIQLATQALSKYKSMLETKRKKSTVKFGTNNPDLIMSHKQVKRLLEEGTSAELPVTSGTIADMKSLCLGLLEALSDKSLALVHQRKANRILASRITDLEQRLDNGKKVVFPSQILLENYCSSDVDRQEMLNASDASSPTNLDEKGVLDDVITLQNTLKTDVEANENEMKLPPQLQKLVDKALQDLDAEKCS